MPVAMPGIAEKVAPMSVERSNVPFPARRITEPSTTMSLMSRAANMLGRNVSPPSVET